MSRREASTVLSAFGDPPPPEALAEAVRVLADGRPVGIPTDTVYGLAIDPFRPGATDRVFEAKHRPRSVALAVLVADRDQALTLAASVPDAARVLMDRFWPGALTVVVAGRPGLPADLGDDGRTVGLRCPDHPLARALCELVGPLATTSANVHGGPALTTAEEVASAFATSVPLVLDGGVCTGLASTVVDCTGPEVKLLREGRVAWAEVQAALAGR